MIHRYKRIAWAAIIIGTMMLANCGGGGTAAQFDDPDLEANSSKIQADVTEAEIIIVGTITAIGTAPQFWSGIEWVTQPVTYTVDAVLKGTYSDPEMTVYHVLVDGSRLAADTPGLAASTFAVGNKLIAMLKENPDYVDFGEGWTVPRFMDFDENYGTIPYSADNQQVIENMISTGAAASVAAHVAESYEVTGTIDPTKTLTINGSAADVQSFNSLLANCIEQSSTLQDLVSMINNSEDYTVTISVVRNAENVFVDSFTGRQVDIDDLEKWHAGCNDKTELCQLYAHFLQEYWHAAVTGDGYAPSHESAILHENKIREDMGKTTTLTGHTGVWQGSDLYCSTTYGANTELVKIGGGSNPYPESVTVRKSPPAAPTNITVDDGTSCQISVNWQDNATNEEGFEIQRREGETGEWIAVHTVGPDTVGWTNTPANATPALELGKTYCYRVRAYNTQDATTQYSAWTEVACGVKQ